MRERKKDAMLISGGLIVYIANFLLSFFFCRSFFFSSFVLSCLNVIFDIRDRLPPKVSWAQSIAMSVLFESFERTRAGIWTVMCVFVDGYSLTRNVVWRVSEKVRETEYK